eukprot:1250598-Heterocapsa_arctica.AAC.1
MDVEATWAQRAGVPASVLWMCTACPPKNWRHRHSRVSGECRLAAGGAPDAHPPAREAPAAPEDVPPPPAAP